MSETTIEYWWIKMNFSGDPEPAAIDFINGTPRRIHLIGGDLTLLPQQVIMVCKIEPPK